MKFKKPTAILLVAIIATGLLAGCDPNAKPYKEAEALFTDGQYAEAAAAFEALGEAGYMDSTERAMEAKYENAAALKKQEKYAEAAAIFDKLGDYKEAISLAEEARNEQKYADAAKLFAQGEYKAAITAFRALGDFKDAKDRAEEAKNEEIYRDAADLFEQGRYSMARWRFADLGEYKDAPERAELAQKEEQYANAIDYIGAYRMAQARNTLLELGDFRDAADKLREVEGMLDAAYLKAAESMEQGDFDEAMARFTALGGYKDAPARAAEANNEITYLQGVSKIAAGDYNSAVNTFMGLGDFRDAPALIEEAKRLIAEAEALLEKLRLNPSSAKKFKPANPNPQYYFICAAPVIDPVTGRNSTGGYGKSYSRHLPVDAESVLGAGWSIGGGLERTDNPNLAAYVLVVTFSYNNGTGRFHFNDGTSVRQYAGTTKAELRNLITGKSLYSESKTTYATYTGESVYTQMLNNAKGKQLYADYAYIKASDFEEFDAFVKIAE